MNVSTEKKDIDCESLKESIDASVEVYISDDNLQASLIISPPQNGGLKCSFPSIRKSLAESGVIYGLDSQKLFQLCENPVYNSKIIVAKGLAPVNGVDGKFDIKFNTKNDSKLVKKEDGSVDFYNLDNIENIKKDQLLCSIVPPREGKDGMSVLGKKITSIKGKPVPPLSGKNTRINEEGTEIRSNIDGQVNYIHGKIKVDETFYIKGDVDNTTGNINVIGNVVVTGTVQPGFLVEATGNIQIGGGLSSVTLIAGGDIVLSCGIIVGDIRCEGDLSSRFIENCKVHVKGDIRTDYVMNSDVICGKSLHAINSISKIVGGQYLVGENIEANIIGSPANVKTYLEIGLDPEIIKRRKELQTEIENSETQIQSLRQLISLLRNLEANEQLSPDQKTCLENSLFSLDSITSSIRHIEKELSEISKLINSITSGRVICKGIVYSGTSVKIASAKIKINNSIFNKSLSYLNQAIHISKA